jgi:hypothetical protein
VIGTPDRSSATGFYVVGGTLRRDAASYVARDADIRILESLKQGDFCYVLTARQMGKSSLMVRTASRLRSEQAHVVVLDLTALGQNLTIEQWYNGLLERIGEQLDLEGELEQAWLRQEHLGPLQRWMRVVREVLLSKRAGNIVIFIDEIDSVRSLDFSTDEFFAGIRELYNRRAQEPELNRLTFCLLGVATPSDLIRDTRTTPFNIGRRIELSDFTEPEAAPLALGLSRNGHDGSALLRRVLYWTGGHPYLTQRLCWAVAQDETALSVSAVDRICRDLFLSLRAREHDDNLLFVRERMLRSEVDTPSLLTLYGKIRAGKKVRDDDTNRLIGVLRLAGISRSQKGLLRLRNRIYERVFDSDWILANMPGAELRRQRAAYQRGLRVAGLAAVPIVLAGGALVFNLYSHSVASPQVSKPLLPPPFWASFSVSSAALINSGSLVVSAGAPDVAIFVGEQQYGRTAKDGTLQIDRLQAGTYVIQARKPGFQSISLPVDIKAQSATPVKITLQEEAKAVMLDFVVLKGAPPGAQLSVDGQDRGASEAGDFQVTAPPGQHTIRISKEGFLPFEIATQFTPGMKANSIEVQMKPDLELSRWKTLADSGDASALRAYLRDYPIGRFSAQARDRADLVEWNGLKDRNDADAVRALSDFVDQCRNSAICQQARSRMNSLAAEDEAWVSATRSANAAQYQRYLADYPQGRYAAAARLQMVKLKDETEIHGLIEQYEAAYNRKDLDGMVSLWPSFPPAVQQRTRQTFKVAKSVTMTLTFGEPQITGPAASVVCKRTRDIVGADEGSGHTQDQVTFRFSRQNDHWIIDSAPH